MIGPNPAYLTPSPALGGFDWMGSSVFQGNALLGAQANLLSIGMMDMRGLTSMVSRMNGSPYAAAGGPSPQAANAQALQQALLAAVASLQTQGAGPLPAAGSPLNLVRNQ